MVNYVYRNICIRSVKGASEQGRRGAEGCWGRGGEKQKPFPGRKYIYIYIKEDKPRIRWSEKQSDRRGLTPQELGRRGPQAWERSDDSFNGQEKIIAVNSPMEDDKGA